MIFTNLDEKLVLITHPCSGAFDLLGADLFGDLCFGLCVTEHFDYEPGTLLGCSEEMLYVESLWGAARLVNY